MIVGIDIDTWKLTVCGISDEMVAWKQQPLRRSGETLFSAIQQVPVALALALDLGQPVEEVYVERGRGQWRTADFDLGAIYGAVAVAVRRVCPNAYVGSVSVTDWKKSVTAAVGITTAKGQPGNANAKKEIANDACRELLLARGVSYQGWTPDALDAFGVVYCVEQLQAAA